MTGGLWWDVDAPRTSVVEAAMSAQDYAARDEGMRRTEGGSLACEHGVLPWCAGCREAFRAQLMAAGWEVE